MRGAHDRARGISDVVFLWLACAVTLCAGYSIAFGVLGRAIDAQRERTGRIVDTARANARIIAARPLLERQARLVDARLSALALDADTPNTVAHFIRIAADAATAQHVDIDRIEERSPTGNAGLSSPADRVPGAEAFEAIPLDVTLSGDYRSLLATIRAFANAPDTMQIEIAALERSAPPGAGQASTGVRLAAHLHVSLQRFASAAGTSTHAFAEDQTLHARSL